MVGEVFESGGTLESGGPIKVRCLPGRVAVLVEEAERSEILIPDAVRRRAIAMERPPYGLLRGRVVSVGDPRGRVPMPSVGHEVWVLPKPGLIIEPGDIDLPSLGTCVPGGFSLRLYGVGDPWFESVLGFA